MNITVLNGSPKGPTSATMQYVHYIQKKFPEHELQIISISQRIEKIEDDAQAFQNILDGISSSDAILWASPVYYYLLPSNYKRFIELISEKGVEDVFHNKYTAFLTTSIHFFDHRAGSHRFLATHENRYRLAFKIVQIGTRITERFEIRQRARSLMTEFSQTFKDIINIGQLDGSEILHVDKIDSPEVLRMDSLLGPRAPAYCTALGKAVLKYCGNTSDF